MKKLFARLLGAALLLSISLSSCVRDYTCQCEISYSGQPALPDTTIRQYNVRDSKKKAAAICQENSFEAEVNGIKTVEKCDLF